MCLLAVNIVAPAGVDNIFPKLCVAHVSLCYRRTLSASSQSMFIVFVSVAGQKVLCY